MQTRLVFLGTGSGAPSRERNVSAMAMIIDGHVLLFDCGEGTQHQLLRAPVRSGAIEAIFTSHLHGDHVYGLPGLLATLSLNGRSAPLQLFGPPGTRAYLVNTLTTSYHNPQFPIDVVESPCRGGIPAGHIAGCTIDCAPLDHVIPALAWRITEPSRPGRFDMEKARALGIPPGPLYSQLQRGEDVTVAGRVIRSADVVGPSRPGRRIVYCTDTRPCASAIELARGADVLVHESTYGEEMATEAHDRGHSTAAGAARVAAAAGVGELILTHFSPRYTDVTPLLAEAQRIFPKTSAASDLSVYDLA